MEELVDLPWMVPILCIYTLGQSGQLSDLHQFKKLYLSAKVPGMGKIFQWNFWYERLAGQVWNLPNMTVDDVKAAVKENEDRHKNYGTRRTAPSDDVSTSQSEGHNFYAQ